MGTFIRRLLPTAFAILIVLTCGNQVASAQQGTATQDPISVKVEPQTPSPGFETTISLESTSVDLGASTMTWSVDGVVMQEGSSIKSFTFKMGPAGQQTKVTLTVKPRVGSSFTRTFTFRPGSVIILWEADTYVPPFYPGKSFASPGANLRFQAFPQVTDQSGNPIASSQLVFNWEINGEVYADRSGKGRSTLDLPGNQLNGAESVSVEILRPDRSSAARGYVTAPSVDPFIRFYKRDPLRGVIYSEALLGEKKLTEAETTLVAEPYYISGKVRAQSRFSYEWMLNNNQVASEGGDPLMITLRQNGQQTGSADLSFKLQNLDPKRILQQATGALRLILGETGANTSGL